jgi:transposase
MLLAAIGIDVAKDHLAIHFDGKDLVVDNRAPAIRAWLKTLPKDAVLGLESTGGYGIDLAEIATKRGFVVFVLSPRQVANYRRSLGRRAKTDRLDARLIAEFVRAGAEQLRPYVPWQEPWKGLRRLVRMRATMVKHAAATRQSLRAHGATPAFVRRTLSSVQAAVDELERKIAGFLESHPEGKLLLSVKGVGPITAAASLAALKHVPFEHKDAFVAYIGNDLIVEESGTYRGKRRVSSWGDRTLRSLFVTAASSAARSHVWREYYDKQIAKGMSATAARCALARRLQRAVFGVYQSGRPFSPHPRVDTQP